MIRTLGDDRLSAGTDEARPLLAVVAESPHLVAGNPNGVAAAPDRLADLDRPVAKRKQLSELSVHLGEDALQHDLFGVLIHIAHGAENAASEQ